jgi:hypothetical protein
MKNEHKIKEIQFSSGAYWIETVYTGEFILKISFNKLLCKYSYKSNFYKNIIKWKITKRHLYKFNNELIVLDIFSWNKKYTENVEDGGYWSLKIKYGKNEYLEINGDNAYPENYYDFINILKKYFPIIKIDNEYRKKIQVNNKM